MSVSDATYGDLDYDGFVASLQGMAPPLTAGPALRALWYDANDRHESALRAANADESHSCLRVRAYLGRKAGDARGAQRHYWLSGSTPWQGTSESEWEDIVRGVLVEVIVERSYL
jgi:hypothetical protein